MRSRPTIKLLAAAMICGGCVGEGDPPSRSTTEIPSSDQQWRIENLGAPRINHSSLREGEVGGYTRQLNVYAPRSGTVTLSGKIWIRLGPNAETLSSPSRKDAFGINCDLEMVERGDSGNNPSFGQTCQNATTTPWVSGCGWPVTVERGWNPRLLQLYCTVHGTGQPRAFAIGVLELTACTHSICQMVEIDPAVRYQAGADIPRPNDLIIFVMTP